MSLEGAVGRLPTALLRQVRTEAVRGAALSLGLKVAMSALNLLMLTLIARGMGAHEFGIFAFWYNGLVFLAVAAGLGQEKLILRHWSEFRAREAWDLARGALRFGTATSIAGSLVVATAVLLTGLATGSDPALVVAAAAFLVMQTLFFYSAHVARAAVGVLRAHAHELTWRAVVIVATLAALMSGRAFQTTHFFVAATAGLAVGLVAQIVSVRDVLPREIRQASLRIERWSWSVRSMKMSLGGNLEAAGQYLEVIAVGLALEPSAAGAYFVASRLANIFLMISSGLDSFTTRQIPALFYAGGPAAVTPLLRKLAVLTGVPVAVGLAGIVLFGHPILGLFGEAYRTAYPILVTLAAGTAILALTGPSMPVLVLTGHEGTYSLCLGATLAARLAAVVALAHWYGPVGAAAGSAAVTVAGGIALALACRVKAGIDPAVTSILAPAREPRG